jgi:predicted DNA-binding protein (MmcQ/YjbR family)
VTFEKIKKIALALPGATYDVKWGADRCFSVGGKMFCVAGHEGNAKPRLTLKVSDASFQMLCDEGVAEPSPYLGRYKWVTFKGPDSVPDDQLAAYIKTAHALVAAKLPGKERKALGIG